MTQETKLKFYTSQETGKLVSFVSVTKAKRLKGVREDSDCKKKIVVLSSDLTDSLKPNVLYNVILTEMKNKKGYVVKSASPVLFEAEIDQCIIPKAVYKVSVKCGNKTIFFDGKSDSSRTLQGALKALEVREDIANKELVITDFKEKGLETIRQMEADGYYVKA